MSEPEYSGKPLAYLDQNILSEFVKKIDLNNEIFPYLNENFQIVYSSTTLAEIYKAFLNSTEENKEEVIEKYLNILTALNANHIQIIHETDSIAISNAPVTEWFHKYIENEKEWGFLDKSIFNQMLLSYQKEKNFEEIKSESINAFQKNYEIMEKSVNNLKNFPELQSLCKNLCLQVDKQKDSYAKMIDFVFSKIKQHAEKEKLSEIFRNETGIYPKHLNNIQMPKAIEKIWSLYKGKDGYTGKSIEDFLTINFWEKQKGQKLFDHEKVTLIYNFLNFIGFNQDTELDQINGAQRAMNDFTHAQLASFCHFFFTNDNKLIKKINPIYEYLDRTTQLARIDINQNNISITFIRI